MRLKKCPTLLKNPGFFSLPVAGVGGPVVAGDAGGFGIVTGCGAAAVL